MNEALYLSRPDIFPKKSSDCPLLTFTFVMIPVTYWFEIWVVLPALFSDWPGMYWTVFVLGHFLLHNVVGNFLAILIFDTSIRGREMPSEEEPGVQFCSSCNIITPPRSFHCPSCDICILKRDHHCIFTGCCVGFYNHRYFLFFIFYTMLCTAISLPFNMYFLWRAVSVSELSFLVIIIFPVLLLFINKGSNNIELEHIYFLVSVLGIFIAFFCSALFYFHMKLILRGTVVHELKKYINTYNYGTKKNLQLALGKRWYLTWISPFINSKLICNGITYPVVAKDKLQ